MLHVVVRSQGVEQVVDHQSGPLEFGRGVARDVARCFLTDPYVSRNHARVELQPNGELLVENLSQMSPIGLDDGELIGTGEVRSLGLPQRLRMGESEVELSRTGVEAGPPAPKDLAKTVIAMAPPEAVPVPGVSAAGTQAGPWRANQAGGPGSTVIAGAPPSEPAPPSPPAGGWDAPAGPGTTVIAGPPPSEPAPPPSRPAGGWDAPAGPGATVIAGPPPSDPAQPPSPHARGWDAAAGPGATVIAGPPPSDPAQPPSPAAGGWDAPAGPGATVIAGPPPSEPPPPPSRPSGGWDAAAGPGSTLIAAFPGDAGAPQREPPGPGESEALGPAGDEPGRTVIAAMPPGVPAAEHAQHGAAETWSYQPAATVIVGASAPPPAEESPTWDPEPVAQAQGPAESEQAVAAPEREQAADVVPGIGGEEQSIPGAEAEPAPAPVLEFLFRLSVTTEPPLSSFLARAPATRALLPVTGGTFGGERLEGVLSHRAGSLLLTVAREGELRLEIRLSLESGPERTILALGDAIVTGPQDDAMVRATLWFETQDESTAWLSRAPAVADGRANADGLSLEVYALR